MKRKIIVAISALILAMGLASCASFLGAYDLNEKIGLLELGMTKEVVMKGLGEKPFFISREIVQGAEQEIYTYKGMAPRGTFSSYYMLYHLSFREGKLVAINTEEDVARTVRVYSEKIRYNSVTSN